MNDDERRQLARNAQSVQNLQLMLLVGMIVGGIVGVLVAAYVILPAMDVTFGSMILALAVIFGSAIAGQRLVLSLMAR